MSSSSSRFNRTAKATIAPVIKSGKKINKSAKKGSEELFAAMESAKFAAMESAKRGSEGLFAAMESAKFAAMESAKRGSEGLFAAMESAKRGSEGLFAAMKVPTINWTPLFSEVPDSLETVAMEMFLNDMAREKPIRFSPHQLVGFTNNFSTKLGSGGFGVVYRGAFPNGVQIAVKVLNGNLDNSVKEQFMAEIGTIGRTYHINLVRLYGFCFDATIRALVYEHMDNGSLDMILFGKNPRIEWGKFHEIAIGTAKGIAYLHEECEQRIIHYDIKPGNVLLDGNFLPKVADFGLAKLCDRDRTHVTMTGGRGTPGYAAPELWMPFQITHKCDVYSFGMMLFEIVGRRRNLDVNLPESQEWFPRWVWKKFEEGELKEMIASFEIEEKYREKAEKTVMVALWCVQYLPESRPPMSSVVKMLEEGSEIIPPPNPFQHLVASSASSLVWSETESGLDSIFDDSGYRATTPMLKKYDREVASSSQQE